MGRDNYVSAGRLLPEKGQETFQGQFSQADLEEVLQAHKLWLKSSGQEGTQANFCNAHLQEVFLAGQ